MLTLSSVLRSILTLGLLVCPIRKLVHVQYGNNKVNTHMKMRFSSNFIILLYFVKAVSVIVKVTYKQ